MMINRRNKISFLLLFLFVNILAIGQTYYYKQTKIVVNKQTNKGDYSGQFITFISDRCYDSDNKGYTVENGVLQLLKETANIKIYYGPSYWGKAYYYVSNDFNRINIKIEDNGKILVYEKSIPNSGTYTSYYTKRANRIIAPISPTIDNPKNAVGKIVKEVCPVCKGSGRSPHTQPGTNFTGGQVTSIEYCEICGKYSERHTHGTCENCLGKGYVEHYKSK